MPNICAKLLSGKEIVQGAYASTEAFLKDLFLNMEHQAVVKLVDGNEVVNEITQKPSAPQPRKDITILMCESNSTNHAKIYRHRHYCIEPRPWKRIRMENDGIMALPRYVTDMMKGKWTRQLAWGLLVPCELLAPAFCNRCFALTSKFGAYVQDWRPTTNASWHCPSCQKQRPRFHCSRCERPIWPEDEEHCGEKLGDDSDDEPDMWCPACVLT